MDILSWIGPNGSGKMTLPINYWNKICMVGHCRTFLHLIYKLWWAITTTELLRRIQQNAIMVVIHVMCAHICVFVFVAHCNMKSAFHEKNSDNITKRDIHNHSLAILYAHIPIPFATMQNMPIFDYDIRI